MPGGVCAVLDYDVEMMADYVAEMATRLSMGHSDVSGAFRKFVSQILTSTRLPSTTILLGMNYMAKKLNIMAMNSGQRPKMTEGQLWRMVTIAFLLGSKFLDDNTFQNRSWSEVSGIAVQELNTLEQEWLAAIGWSLYVNLDRSKDYAAWLKSWQEWQENKKRQQARATRERLLPLVPPIDTDVLRSRNTHSYTAWHRQQVAEYERLQNLNLKRNELSPQSTVSTQDPWYPRGVGHWNMANGAHCSHPLTPPDSGYGTPEVYLGSAILNSNTPHDAPYNDWFAGGLANAAYTRQGQYQHQTASRSMYSGGRPHSTHTGYYGYGHNIWEPGIADCNCANCVSSAQSKHQPYFGMTHSYGQPVMG